MKVISFSSHCCLINAVAFLCLIIPVLKGTENVNIFHNLKKFSLLVFFVGRNVDLTIIVIEIRKSVIYFLLIYTTIIILRVIVKEGWMKWKRLVLIQKLNNIEEQN